MRASVGPHRLDPLFISKINTLIQIALVGFVLARLGVGAQAGWAEALLIAATAITTVFSGFSYLRALASHNPRSGTGAVNPRVVRALFWIGFCLLVVVVLGLVQSILMPFVVGFAIAYVLAPAVARLEQWGIRRTLASFLVVILFLLGLALILVILVPLIQGQVIQLIVSIPTWSARCRTS